MGRRLCDMFTLILLCSQLVGVDSAETPCGSWTDWVSDENGGPIDPAGQGEFEIISQLRVANPSICESPSDIECALANDLNTAYNEANQVEVTCSSSAGLTCFHDKQEGGSKCLDYAIRLLCPGPCVIVCVEISTQTLCNATDDLHGQKSHTTFEMGLIWNENFKNQSSCVYQNTAADISDMLFAIFRSVDLDIFQCCDIKHLRSKISTNENVAVEVELYLLSGETITKDELYKAFIDGAAKTNNTINLESITINVEPEPGPQGLKTGAIVGIVVGSIAVICLIPVCVTVIIYCVKKAGAKAVVGAGSG